MCLRLAIISCLVLCIGCRTEPKLHHAGPTIHQVDPAVAVYVGGQLDGYAGLQELGFRSVIDVDATTPRTQPNVDMQIVHLPLRYSGITEEEARALAGALGSMDRPIYVHCHHGTNRAPAAVAVGLVGTGEWTPNQGMRLLERIGTDRAFTGLYDSVAAADGIAPADRMSIKQLARTVDGFPVLMAGIDEVWATLVEDLRSRRPSPDAAAQSAEFVDMLRVAFDTDARMEAEGYRALADQAVAHATALEHALRTDQLRRIRELVDAVQTTCTACHRRFRD